jgi:O-antigen polysaccharide polymerase Wzy
MHSIAQASLSPKSNPTQAGRYLLWPSGAVLLLTLSSITSQNITLSEFVYAGVFLAISIQAYVSWRQARNIRVPVWALVCAVHFVFYGIAIFGALRNSPSAFDHGSQLSNAVLSTAMLLGIFGLLSMGAGRTAAMHLVGRKALRIPFLTRNTPTPARIQILVLIGTVVNVFGVPFYGTVVWNISVIAFNALPLAAFLWLVLVRRFRKLSQLDFLLAIAFLSTRIISGARFNASLGTIVAPLLLIGVAEVSLKRKLPWPMITVVACLILFLQPGKGRIRHEMNRGQVGDGMMDAAVRWFDVSLSEWDDVLAGRSPLDKQLTTTSSRSSLLTMTGVILEKTPEIVPYQLGTSYPLLIKNLIPRVLWPEKPSANIANQFFQVEYGVTEKSNLKSVSIACGFEAEGYMNFGWVGVLAVGLVVGFVLGVYELAFFSAGSSLTAIAVGLAMLPGFLTIESQLVQYLGGILQLVFGAAIVFHREKGNRSSNDVAGVQTETPSCALHSL